MINVFCYYFGTGGWCRHAQGFLAALRRYEDIALLPWEQPTSREVITPGIATMLANARGPMAQNIALGIGPVDNMGTLIGRKKIAYVAWETTRVPVKKRRILQQVDEIWVPSQWGKAMLLHNGFPADVIKVVPEGVDCDLFRPVLASPFQDRQPFRFLCVGKWEERKGIVDLVRTYATTFREEEPVELVLHCANRYIADFDLARAFQAIQPARHAAITLCNPMTEHELVTLYNRCDAFVLPTKAEAWGLPIIEAMACALPVIVTDYSGYQDYLDDTCGYLIKVKNMTRVRDVLFYPGRGYGRWAQPDLKHLSSLLRYVFEHRDEAREKGVRAREHVAQHWTWDHAARIAHAYLHRY